MIVKLSLIVSGSALLLCLDEDAGMAVEFLSFDEGIMLTACRGFNDELGFMMRYAHGEVDVYDNEIKLIKEN